MLEHEVLGVLVFYRGGVLWLNQLFGEILLFSLLTAWSRG